MDHAATLVPDDAYSGRLVAVDDPPPLEVQVEATASTNPPLLLTIAEAADRLRVGRCTMQELLLSGEVRSFKIGRLRRIPPEALSEYIENRMAG